MGTTEKLSHGFVNSMVISGGLRLQVGGNYSLLGVGTFCEYRHSGLHKKEFILCISVKCENIYYNIKVKQER